MFLATRNNQQFSTQMLRRMNKLNSTFSAIILPAAFRHTQSALLKAEESLTVICFEFNPYKGELYMCPGTFQADLTIKHLFNMKD